MKKIITVFMCSMLAFGPMAAQAAMVSSSSVVVEQDIQAYFSQPELTTRLEAMGVDTQLLQDRLGSMTAAERQQLSDRLGQLPAGQASALNMLFLIFLVFVITDILGATDIFPFINEI